MSKYTELKEKYKGKRIILHVASYLSPMKGTDYAIEAMGYVNKEFPDALLLVISSINDPKRTMELGILALNCGAKVEFVIGVKDEDMPAYYSLAEVLLAPSLDENVHLPQLEAQSCECPVIGFKFGIQSEEIGMQAGFVFNPRKYDDEYFGRAICMYLRTPSVIARDGKNARQFVINNFSWDKCIENYKRIIKEIASEKKM